MDSEEVLMMTIDKLEDEIAILKGQRDELLAACRLAKNHLFPNFPEHAHDMAWAATQAIRAAIGRAEDNPYIEAILKGMDKDRNDRKAGVPKLPDKGSNYDHRLPSDPVRDEPHG